MLSEDILRWIAGRRFYGGYSGKNVLEEICGAVPDFRYLDYFHNGDPAESLTRRIASTGLSRSLLAVSHRERTEGAHVRRVHLFDNGPRKRGDAVQTADAGVIRDRLRTRLDHHLVFAPSRTAAYVWLRMNDRPAALYEPITRHLDEARHAVGKRQITVSNKYGDRDPQAEDRLRAYYYDVLNAIAEQPQQFYTFSQRGRTDRIFPYNPGMLSLPSDIRRILCQDYFEIDLRSAHLLIAAALWDARLALSRLVDQSYNVWDDLIDYLGKGSLCRTSVLYSTLKDALKTAVYSTVYGMCEANIAGQFTLATKDVLGSTAGRRLRSHPIIRELLECRETKMQDIVLEGRLRTPTGIRADLNASKNQNPRNILATAAQSYEQYFMSLILQYEQALPESTRNTFRVVAWIHDGCYVEFGNWRDVDDFIKTGSNRIVNQLQALLTDRSNDLRVPAFFEAAPVYPRENLLASLATSPATCPRVLESDDPVHSAVLSDG